MAHLESVEAAVSLPCDQGCENQCAIRISVARMCNGRIGLVFFRSITIWYVAASPHKQRSTKSS